MPGVSKGSDELVLEAVERGAFPQEKLDAAAERIVALGLHHKDVKPVPFGHGLSYTGFAYGDMAAEWDGTDVKVSCAVTNTGAVSGKETVQLYISHKNPRIFKAAQELKGFQKVDLRPGQRTRVEFTLAREDFAYYNVDIHGWHMDGGE